jgi:hypothetical protein
MSTETQTAEPEKIPIFIDGAKYEAHSRELTGAQIRVLAKPPVGEDRDLWLDIVDKLDELIPDDKLVEIEAKMRFFTVPRVINPGSANQPHLTDPMDRP